MEGKFRFGFGFALSLFGCMDGEGEGEFPCFVEYLFGERDMVLNLEGFGLEELDGIGEVFGDLVVAVFELGVVGADALDLTKGVRVVLIGDGSEGKEAIAQECAVS